jgi:hypothetical protein
MESAEAVAAKRRVLVDALMMCLERSRVAQVVDGPTVRGVLSSAAGELWREGEFRLDPVWKILIQQPGLSAEDVAPPLLAFKGYEQELGVQVRMPQALTAIPRAEQVRLRETLGLQRADFQRAIDEMREFAAAEARVRVSSRQLRAVSGSQSTTPAAPPAPSPSGTSLPVVPVEPVTAPRPAPPSDKRALALVLGLLALVGVALSAWLSLRDTAHSFALDDVAGTLQLGNGRAADGSLTAVIQDTRWESLSPDERRKAVSAIMDVEQPKGIRAMTLLDGGGGLRAMVTEGPNGRNILLP